MSLAKLKFDFVPPVREALVEKSMDNPNPARFVAVLDKKSLYKACEELKKVVQGIP